MSLMNSTVVPIPNENEASLSNNKRIQSSLSSLIRCLHKKDTHDSKQLIHSFKVGIALVLASLLYLLTSLYDMVGENAMWTIMTVVVIFEFSAGATLSKGLNRGVGTILGGLLGCLAANLAEGLGGISRPIAVGISVFFFSAAASYSRMVPSINRKYDYGVVIFILTFNLVVVSGIRGEKVMDLARERLLTIGIGFAICIFMSLFVFPVWSSDELHSSIASKFNDLARSTEGCLSVYFKPVAEKDDQGIDNFNGYISVLHSKSKDDTLAKFARWEPWHGKFGFTYPWEKYLQIGELLRDLAASIHSLKGCLQSPRQPSSMPLRLSVKEPSEAVATMLACTLRELGDSILKMRKSGSQVLMVSKLQNMRLKLNVVISGTKLGTLEDGGLALASFVFLLMEMVDKVEELAKDIEELGDLAGFLPQESDLV